MQFSRNAPALLVLRAQEARAQVIYFLLNTLKLGYVGGDDADAISLPARILEWELCRQISSISRPAIQYLFLDDGSAFVHHQLVLRRQGLGDVGRKEIGCAPAQEIAFSQGARATIDVGIPTLTILDVDEGRRVVEDRAQLFVRELHLRRRARSFHDKPGQH